MDTIGLSYTVHTVQSVLGCLLIELTDGERFKFNLKNQTSCKTLRKSPLKTEVPQSYVKKQHGNPLIILDSKTRRNSLLAMLERFLEIWPSTANALIDCQSELNLSKEELAAVQDIVSASQPVKAGAEKLTNRETTILAAEGVFTIMLEELAA